MTSEVQPRSSSEWLIQLSQILFSQTKSTEDMIRGSIDEASVANYLRSQDFTVRFYEVALLCGRDRPSIACSPDRIALLDLYSTPSLCFVPSFKYAHHDNSIIAVATVVIKKSFRKQT